MFLSTDRIIYEEIEGTVYDYWCKICLCHFNCTAYTVKNSYENLIRNTVEHCGK